MSIILSFYDIAQTSESNRSFSTLAEIIEAAYREINELHENQELSVERFERGKYLLNALIENWPGNRTLIWKRDFITLSPPKADIVKYNGDDYKCVRSHVSNVDNAPDGPLSISYWVKAESDVGVTWGDDIQYVSNKELVMNPNIVDVLNARIKRANSTYTNAGTMPLQKITREAYFNNLIQDQEGEPFQFYFEKDHVNVMFLYPSVKEEQSDFVIELEVERYPDIFDDYSNNDDFLREWRMPLIFNLAYILGGQSSISNTRLANIKAIADDALKNAEGLNNERTDIYLSTFDNSGNINW